MWEYRITDAILLVDKGVNKMNISIFINPTTGEIKLFEDRVFQERGIDTILKELNKNDKPKP